MIKFATGQLEVVGDKRSLEVFFPDSHPIECRYIKTPLLSLAELKATEQPIDTTTAAGKCFLDMLGVFAEFETNLRKERQAEGIAKAKAKGVYKGRRPSIDVGQVRELKEKGLGASAIAKELGIGRASVYRVLGG